MDRTKVAAHQVSIELQCISEIRNFYADHSTLPIPLRWLR
jgi:hypothetical protein